MSNLNQQNIVLTVANIDLQFTVTRDIFNQFTNEMVPNDKVAPANQFLARSINDDSKADFAKIVKDYPGSEIEIAGALAEEYKPDLSIIVKKPKTNANKSSDAPTAN
jgi:hypothetical protein